ncbi:MAG: cytochrome c5 family protein [Gammaproteobacteria bacterium]
MSQDHDAQFIRLFLTILLLLTVAGVIVAFVGRGLDSKYGPKPPAESAASEHIKPVGEVNTGAPIAPVADTAAAAPAAAGDKGKQVYDTLCMACHATPALGAPVFGNAADWAPRLEKGVDTLVKNAINGFQGAKGVMPAKGGNAALPDEDVKAAVLYMLSNSGGADAVAKSGGAAAPAAAAAPPQAAADGAALGKDTYDKACHICHTPGAAGAPKLGDKEAWAPRIAQGLDTLHTHAIVGFTGKNGLMPAKGGRADFSDEQVKAAVDYMVQAAK